MVVHTFLFTDIENSTPLWDKHPGVMQELAARHDALLRKAIEGHHGRVVKTTGDGFHAVFEAASDGIAAAVTAQLALNSEDWPAETGPLKVRMGLHSGESQERNGDYYGSTVNMSARIMDAGHGGQILITETTLSLLQNRNLDSIAFSDLGAHRLKGLVQSAEIYQLIHPSLATKFPPLRTASVPKHNLPSQTTPIVGRDREIAYLSKLLDDPDTTLISIVAPGGMGKSRLAIEIGNRTVDKFRNGVFFVELAPIDDHENIVPALAEGVGYQFQQNGRSQKQQILNYLANKHILLIFDNFEHLIGGSRIVTEILGLSPGLKILVTTRQRINQPGETLYTLQGLDLPNGETKSALNNASVRLFEQTGRRTRPDFILNHENLPLVIHICHLVQGMPLGILLAAPWINVLSLEEIVQEIRHGLDILEAEGSELPERQRSIRVVFDQAWSMMSAKEQKAFMNLAVFRGGFSREAGQKVAHVGLRQLQSWINKALLERDVEQRRFHAHELLRQYAEEKLLQADLDEQAHDDHARYYLTYLAAQAHSLKGAKQLATIAAIEVDFDNIREAWNWASAKRDFELLKSASETMYIFCLLQSRLDDGKALFDRARQNLAPEPGENPDPVWLSAGIRFYSMADNRDEISDRLILALQEAEERDDPFEVAYCLYNLATIAHFVDQDPAKAIEFYLDCAAIYRQLDETYYLAHVFSNLGEAYQLIGQNDSTVKYIQKAYQLQRQIGDRMGESETLRAMSMTAFQAGDYDAMVDYLEKAFTIQLQTGYMVGQASSNLFRGYTRFMKGEIVEGRVLVQLALDQSIDITDYSTQAWSFSMLSMIKSASGEYTEAEDDLAQAQAIEIDPFRQTGAGNPFLQLHINLAAVFLQLGRNNYKSTRSYLVQPLSLAIATSSHPYMTILLAPATIMYANNGSPERAANLFGLAENQSSHAAGWMKYWMLLEKTKNELRVNMGQAAFDTAFDNGQMLDLATTVEEISRDIHQDDK